MLKGLITLWSGSIASIPRTWKLCNGSNGTPDMRDRFVVGAGGAKALDETGGAAAHDHTFTADGHDHRTIFFDGPIGGGDPRFSSNVTDAKTPTGTTDTASTYPPFYALAYIMYTG